MKLNIIETMIIFCFLAMVIGVLSVDKSKIKPEVIEYDCILTPIE